MKEKMDICSYSSVILLRRAVEAEDECLGFTLVFARRELGLGGTRVLRGDEGSGGGHGEDEVRVRGRWRREKTRCANIWRE